MSSTYAYATLRQFRDRDGLATTDSTAYDARRSSHLIAASRMIDHYTHRSFQPIYATEKFDWQDPYCLYLFWKDLVTLVSMTDGLGAVTIANLIQVGAPVYKLAVDRSSSTYLSKLYNNTLALAVTGTWCYHPDFSTAFVDTLQDIPGGGITDSATSFAVTNAFGADAAGISPAIQVGHLLKVGSEYMLVSAIVDSTTDTLTVTRGYNGTTAAAHNAGVAIERFYPMQDVVENTLKLAGWLMAQDDTDAKADTTPFMPKSITDALDNLGLRRVMVP